MIPGRYNGGSAAKSWLRRQRFANEPVYCEATVDNDDDIYCAGSDDDRYESPSHRRQAYETQARRFIEGKPMNLLSATLRGPFAKESGWVNPWRSSRTTTATNARLPKRKRCDDETNAQKKPRAVIPGKQPKPVSVTASNSCQLPSPQSAIPDHEYLGYESVLRVREWASAIPSTSHVIEDSFDGLSLRNPAEDATQKVLPRKGRPSDHSAPNASASAESEESSSSIDVSNLVVGPHTQKPAASLPSDTNAHDRHSSRTSQATPRQRERIRPSLTSVPALEVCDLSPLAVKLYETMSRTRSPTETPNATPHPVPLAEMVSAIKSARKNGDTSFQTCSDKSFRFRSKAPQIRHKTKSKSSLGKTRNDRTLGRAEDTEVNNGHGGLIPAPLEQASSASRASDKLSLGAFSFEKHSQQSILAELDRLPKKLLWPRTQTQNDYSASDPFCEPTPAAASVVVAPPSAPADTAQDREDSFRQKQQEDAMEIDTTAPAGCDLRGGSSPDEDAMDTTEVTGETSASIMDIDVASGQDETELSSETSTDPSSDSSESRGKSPWAGKEAKQEPSSPQHHPSAQDIAPEVFEGAVPDAPEAQSPWLPQVAEVQHPTDQNDTGVFADQATEQTDSSSGPQSPWLPNVAEVQYPTEQADPGVVADLAAQQPESPGPQSPWALDAEPGVAAPRVVTDTPTTTVKPAQLHVVASLMLETKNQQSPWARGDSQIAAVIQPRLFNPISSPAISPSLPTAPAAYFSSPKLPTDPNSDTNNTHNVPSTPDRYTSSLPTPDFTLSVKSFREFMTPSPAKRPPLRPTDSNGRLPSTQLLAEAAQSNPWTRLSGRPKRHRLDSCLSQTKSRKKPKVAKRVSWSLPDDDDGTLNSTTLSFSSSSSSPGTVAVFTDPPQRRSRSASSPPPPGLVDTSDLPPETEKFGKHFAIMAASQRRRARGMPEAHHSTRMTKRVVQLLPSESQQVCPSPPADAMARAFIEADGDVDGAGDPDELLQAACAESCPVDEEDEEEEEEEEEEGETQGGGVDDVTAVLENLDEFLETWDVDVELDKARRVTSGVVGGGGGTALDAEMGVGEV
ncbi:hypothetical protein QBC47DRAFT_428605 [Echria macrotheca]|uniref:Protamine P1 n=1 Tax=Echria macrotheca TaxID=438768 RepID=A0AAJ0BNQ0_9PEZI|nr:hypothetical protein QBC47DRAFT_428605 [Echria macrotheca]